MAGEIKSDLHFEIGHVLFIDIVGYSNLLMNEQRDLVGRLNQLVRSTEQFRVAESAGKLIRLPAGDGMALVFSSTVEAPVQCALEVSKNLRSHPELQVRMGIHSGPVSGVTDVNDRSNIAGAGINIAQRVMDRGDAGHILLSKRAAEDLEQYPQWQACLHDLGECEVKHGKKLGIVNLYTDQIGNPEIPVKFAEAKKQDLGGWPFRMTPSLNRTKAAFFVAALIGIFGVWFFSHQFAVKRPSQRENAGAPSPTIPEKSIAVLPFENLSADQENAFFADGIQDEILTDLAKIADLKVISRTSVMQYKTGAKRNLREIAKALGVAHVVEGRVQRSGNRVRVSAQLIDARTDMHLWAERYDRDLANVFAMQSEIAKTIADQLQARISPSEKAAIEKAPTADLAAFDLYERAKALWADISDPVHARENLPQAAQLLDEAVARDPHFLLGWCLLSRVHGALYWNGFDHTPARLELANSAVQTALRLQPDAGEAHLALANYYYFGFRDYERARNELAIARRTLPNNAEIFLYTGFIDRRQGRWLESSRNLERALELDPRNLFTLQQLASYTYRPQRRYADAARIYDRALTIAPGDPLTRLSRARIALDWRADIKPYQITLAALLTENPSIAPDADHPDYALCERTAAAAARMLKNYPRDGVLTNYGVNCPYAYWEGVVARWQGDTVKAHEAFTAARGEVEKALEQQSDVSAALSLLGIIDAGLGRKAEAIREGRRACELLPVSQDALSGVAFAVNLAQIYAWTGEKDLAIEQLAAIERVPNTLSYGFLKLHPYWDSLRGDPRFEKLVALFAPKP
jgi:TolB-like protein/Tfp pilus assembly protein PilF